MKKIVLALAVAAVFASCQKPESSAPTESGDVFTASVEEFGAQTKTALAPGNYVVWSAGDNLAIFQGSTLANEYEIAESSAGKTNAIFTRVMSSGNDFYAGTELPCNVALYPYAEGLCLDGGMSADGKMAYTVSSLVLPAVQTYQENSFGNGAFPMVAVTQATEDRNLNFKNVLGALKLQLKGTQTVKSIKIEGNDGELLSGSATITAYANNLTPAIKMADDASTEVTLDCGGGVQLSESESTNFYIALPPVLFSDGFTVTVTDVDEKTYMVSASTANTILRSSILVMPAVTLTTSGEGTPDEGDEEDELIIPVSYVNLNSTSLKLYEGDVAQLTATVGPKDATDKTIVWSSNNAEVAVVDQTGRVTAVSAGSATISAVAGGKTGTCSVTVTALAVATADYVDEYGINHGKGIAVGMAIWAPVNCGYHTTDYQWGKLYQWGRKFGQGYSGRLYDVKGNYVEGISDATVPELSEGGVSEVGGNHKSNANVFYYGVSDWVDPRNDKLWNSGSESSPVKTEVDPCPEGWRVPTYTELDELCQNRSSWTTNESDQPGYWFSGASSYTEDVPQVFFPAAGYRGYYGYAYYRGYDGYYWSSSPYYGNAYNLYFGSGYACMNGSIRARGYSVRCVQD